ncbi:hypothetical protein [Tepidibacter mesophilus]|uniref:hypothetical protein n=1 Tax=Tepidibacter mesophilus TaxID=655607 RepID=UPI0016519E04|nr:hypothetical protein [Tepidibacter mesophilus]
MRIEESKLQYILYDNHNNISGILAKIKENEKLIEVIKLCSEIGGNMSLKNKDDK